MNEEIFVLSASAYDDFSSASGEKKKFRAKIFLTLAISPWLTERYTLCHGHNEGGGKGRSWG